MKKEEKKTDWMMHVLLVIVSALVSSLLSVKYADALRAFNINNVKLSELLGLIGITFGLLVIVVAGIVIVRVSLFIIEQILNTISTAATGIIRLFVKEPRKEEKSKTFDLTKWYHKNRSTFGALICIALAFYMAQFTDKYNLLIAISILVLSSAYVVLVGNKY